MEIEMKKLNNHKKKKNKLKKQKDIKSAEESLNEDRKLYAGRCWCDCEACDVHGNHCGNDIRGCMK